MLLQFPLAGLQLSSVQGLLSLHLLPAQRFCIWHMPPMHFSPVAHALSQDPQWASSLFRFVHIPPQFV
jgi:hypothetical protein